MAAAAEITRDSLTPLGLTTFQQTLVEHAEAFFRHETARLMWCIVPPRYGLTTALMTLLSVGQFPRVLYVCLGNSPRSRCHGASKILAAQAGERTVQMRSDRVEVLSKLDGSTRCSIEFWTMSKLKDPPPFGVSSYDLLVFDRLPHEELVNVPTCVNFTGTTRPAWLTGKEKTLIALINTENTISVSTTATTVTREADTMVYQYDHSNDDMWSLICHFNQSLRVSPSECEPE